MANPKASATETATSWKPKTFVPTRRQFEKGVYFTPPSTGIPVWITKDGYRPAKAEDEAKLLSMIEHDPFCGICLFGKQEMSKDERTAVNMTVEKDREIDRLNGELEKLREDLRVSKIAASTSGR